MFFKSIQFVLAYMKDSERNTVLMSWKNVYLNLSPVTNILTWVNLKNFFK